MPNYRVEALEKFIVRTVYYEVEADSPEEAVDICKSGALAYEEKHIEDGDEEWLMTLSVSLCE